MTRSSNLFAVAPAIAEIGRSRAGWLRAHPQVAFLQDGERVPVHHSSPPSEAVDLPRARPRLLGWVATIMRCVCDPAVGKTGEHQGKDGHAA